jgi:hypothetical protein
MGVITTTVLIVGLLLLLLPFTRTKRRDLKGWNWKELLSEAIAWIVWVLFAFFNGAATSP